MFSSGFVIVGEYTLIILVKLSLRRGCFFIHLTDMPRHFCQLCDEILFDSKGHSGLPFFFFTFATPEERLFQVVETIRLWEKHFLLYVNIVVSLIGCLRESKSKSAHIVHNWLNVRMYMYNIWITKTYDIHIC